MNEQDEREFKFQIFLTALAHQIAEACGIDPKDLTSINPETRAQAEERASNDRTFQALMDLLQYIKEEQQQTGEQHEKRSLQSKRIK